MDQATVWLEIESQPSYVYECICMRIYGCVCVYVWVYAYFDPNVCAYVMYKSMDSGLEWEVDANILEKSMSPSIRHSKYGLNNKPD